MTKKENMASLNKLPDSLVEKAYVLDVINKKLQLQYDSFIKDSLKFYFREEKDDFLYYDYCGYRILMETED